MQTELDRGRFRNFINHCEQDYIQHKTKYVSKCNQVLLPKYIYINRIKSKNLTIKKLIKDNPTMIAKFEEL